MGKFFLIVIILLVLVGGIFYFSKRQTTAPTISESVSPAATISRTTPAVTPTSTAAGSPIVTSTPASMTHTLKYLAGGKMELNALTIRVGDKVTFVNNDSVTHWPASGIHPSHQICPGFDALKGLAAGESYTHTFTEVKTCPFHDHLNAGNSPLRGQIIVSP